MPDGTISDRIRAFILEVFYVTDPSILDEQTSLIESGVVDSTGMLDIILFVESEFGISVADHETIPDNFETIGRIARYVEEKLGASSSSAA